MNVLQPPPSFMNQQPEKKPSLEDLLGTFITETRNHFNKDEAQLDNIETHMSNVGATMTSLEVQIGQLATSIGSQQKGKFPSDIEVTPKEQYKVITLRNGKEIKGTKLTVTNENPTATKQNLSLQEGNFGKEIKKQAEQSPENKGHRVVETSDNLPIPKPSIPYPQRLQKKKLNAQFVKFLDIFNKIHINIPFTETLEQMSNYVKFMKDIMSKKRRFKEFETVKLTEECSAIFQRKLPQKLKDPRSFTIPCTIGNSLFRKVLFDLGASINLMAPSVFRKLGLGEVKPSTITLQLADRSLTYPWGVIEGILVKVDKFIFPTNFVVLDMEEDQEILLILGRPILATRRPLIDVLRGQLTLRVNEEEVMFRVYRTMKFPNEIATYHRADTFTECVVKA